MAKSIRRVKSKTKISQALVHQLRHSGTAKIDLQIELLKQFVDLDPIYTGTAEKFSINGTREAWTRHTIKLIKNEGHWLEFGVRSGTSLNLSIQARPTQVIHGFDSWEGLPEDWHTGGKTFRAGAMSVRRNPARTLIK